MGREWGGSGVSVGRYWGNSGERVGKEWGESRERVEREGDCWEMLGNIKDCNENFGPPSFPFKVTTMSI